MNKTAPRVTVLLLLRRARALKRHLPAAIAGSDEGVHQTRVATRRLREAVPVLATGLRHSKAGKAERKIRRLTRALGTVRELDVTLHLLDELTRNEQVPRTAVEEVRAHVIAERDEKRELMLDRLERVDADKLGRRLASVADALGTSDDEGWRTVLSTRLLKRSRRLSAAVDAAGQMYEPERLHAVRISAKKLRYALELAGDSGNAPAARHVRTIKKVQDMLGRLHDLQILQSHVAAVQASSQAGRAGVHGALDALAQHIEAECRHLHGRYIVSAQALRDVCTAIPAEVIPQVDRRPRRPLKMSFARGPATAAAEARR